MIILAAYISFAAVFGYAYRYAMNPDGLSMLRLAGYIAEGNFIRSVTTAWSPLMMWLVAPFLYAGFDGLSAARIVIALCGAALLYCTWQMSFRFELAPNMRFAAVLIAALLISLWTVQFISDDVLFAALILYYLFIATSQQVLTKKISFACGIVSGFGYLAHSYALPFFLVHFPALLILKGYIERDESGIPWGKILTSWIAGMAGFIIIASLWIGMVSIKYGELIISSKGGIAHAAVGPKDIDRRHPFFVGGLFKPKEPYAYHVYEDPSDVKFKTWSPFESREYFIHQLNLIKDNSVYILNHFVNQSPFFTYPFVAGILVLIPIIFLLRPLDKERRFLYSWFILTFAIYCSGFLLLIARSPRRFYALMLLFLLLVFHFMEELRKSLADFLSVKRMKLLNVYLLLIVIAAFTIKPGVQFVKSLRNVITSEQVNPYKEIAEQINTIEFPGPYAIIRSSQKITTDYYINYFLNKQLLGRPLSNDADGINKELKAVDARSLAVFDHPELVDKLKSDERFTYIGSRKLKENKRYEEAINISYQDHEIITGWDKEVNIFVLELN